MITAQAIRAAINAATREYSERLAAMQTCADTTTALQNGIELAQWQNVINGLHAALNMLSTVAPVSFTLDPVSFSPEVAVARVNVLNGNTHTRYLVTLADGEYTLYLKGAAS